MTERRERDAGDLPSGSDMRHPARQVRIGVALGGGSARGYAHIGALAALERNGLAPQVVAGTSFGAVVGALYALGGTPAQLQVQAERLRRRDVLPEVVDFGLHRGALFRGRRLEAYFDRLVEGRSFEDLTRTLVITATDADSGESVQLRSGALAPALRASASLPGLFAPAEVDGRRLIDGGIGAPVPLATLDAFDLDVRLGIGAGMDTDDSDAIRWVRRALGHPWGGRVHRRLHAGGPGAFGRLAQALAWTADGYGVGRAAVGPEGLQVQTRPPIHWLRFDRAEAAIRAGDLALEGAVPAVRAAVREAALVAAGAGTVRAGADAAA
ncbi:MAG: patatin-like phospholipase family protein [Trueperaceae bacterium]